MGSDTSQVTEAIPLRTNAKQKAAQKKWNYMEAMASIAPGPDLGAPLKKIPIYFKAIVQHW